MTTNADNAYGPVPATEPLALKSNEGLGPNATDRRAPLPDHDNHHNALRCPYCNPHRLVLVDPGETAVLVRLLVQCDAVLSTLDGESSDEQERLDALRRAIMAATIPHRPQEADLLSVRACLGRLAEKHRNGGV